jgi:surfeit locus 1 family protein
VPLPDARDWMAWRFRPVVATGRFDDEHQILLDNKMHAGRPGYHVVTPLALVDGRVVLVDRGWIEGGATRAQVPRAAAPTGIVAVHGRINVPAGAYLELGRDTVSGAVWQNLDLARFEQATGIAVLPVIVEQTRSLGETDALVREWPAPDAGVDMHRIYMVQWFVFAMMAAGLWLYFTFRRSP